MKNVLLVAIAYFSFQYAFSQSINNYVENELIIWLEEGVDPYLFSSNYSQQIEPKRVLSPRLNIWLFEYSETNNARSQSMASLQASNEVKYLQNNHFVTSRAITPNDDDYNQQWAPDVINLPDAWDNYSTGGTSALGDEIIIAIIDNGFDLDHEDLNFWQNDNEIPNNGVDDDNNGYVDDFEGWNAYNQTGNIPSNNHGTHVAGIAAALGNNSEGISGVNWNTRVMPIAGSSGNEATVVEAYSYVLEMRARYNETNGQEGAFVVVTNASFGVDQGDPHDFPIWCALYDELGSEGILNCAATANRNWNIDQVGDVPTACTSNFLIAVTNTDENDNKVTSAGFGENAIDLGAPGANIFSTLPNDNYGDRSGTSMATPQVTGVIALMYAAACEDLIEAYRDDPAMVALLMRDFVLEGSENVSSLNGLVAHGRLDALESIDGIFDIQTLNIFPPSPPNNTIYGTISYQADVINFGSDSWGVVVASTADVTMEASQSITIRNLHIEEGAVFRAHISSGFSKCFTNNSSARIANSQSSRTIRDTELDSSSEGEFIFNAYPNPTNEVLTLHSSKDAKIVLYDSFGKIVLDTFIEANSPLSTTVGNLPSGLYFLKVKSENDSEIKRIIISK